MVRKERKSKPIAFSLVPFFICRATLPSALEILTWETLWSFPEKQTIVLSLNQSMGVYFSSQNLNEIATWTSLRF